MRSTELIDSNVLRNYCIYIDSMSVLEAIKNYNDRYHPVVYNILEITSRLCGRGFDTAFFWLPSHIGFCGNERAESVARSTNAHLLLAVLLSDTKHIIVHHILTAWKQDL
ncbi:pggt1b [Trichonephila clavipes]|nr:pggt1b [Trichonephila clavipes]